MRISQHNSIPCLLAGAFALASAATFAAIMVARAASVISLSEPLHLVTSGWEQESLFALWKVVHGLPVYADRFSIPFSASVFNWAFYEGYGAIIRSLMAAHGLSEPYLPTLARLVTACGALAGCSAAAIGYLSLVGPARSRLASAIAIATGVYVGLGPLIGYWAMTARPDAWAFLFEMLAILTFWFFLGRFPLLGVALASVFVVLATSFKQTSGTSLAVILSYLVLQRRWREMSIAVGVFGLAWTATLAVAEKPMVNALLFADYPITFSFDRLVKNLALFALKGLPLAGMLVVALWSVVVGGIALRKNSPVLFGALATLVSGALCTFMAAQSGASENYFFLPAFLMGFTGIAALGELVAQNRFGPVAAGLTSAGWLGSLGVAAAIMTGVGGATLSLSDQHASYAAKQACLNELPRPIFVDNQYLALPWMTPGTPPLVLSFAYEADRLAGKTFERGGVGGMIREGYFAALVLDRIGTGETFDGATLDRYVRAPQGCGNFAVYLRRSGLGDP